MKKRTFSLLLVLTLIIAAGVLVQDFRFDQSIAHERERALTIAGNFTTVETSLASLRAAQAGYVATGQGPDFWMTRVTDLAAGIASALTRLRESSAVATAAPRYLAADAALAEFNRLDARARDFVRTDQRLFASDLVFMDSLQAVEKIQAELAVARAAELADSEQRAVQLARLRLAMNAAAFLGLCVLAFATRPAPSAPVAAPAEPKAKMTPSTLQMLRDLPPPVKNAAPTGPVAPAAPVVTQPAIRPATITAAAELCVDLARVIDARDVPALVQRAASVLDAKGVVLWVADTSGARLSPSMTHGYSDKVVAKMGPLQIDGDNVTSLAFRSMQPQTVTGSSPADPGALAVPLITSSGCVGVLSAETRPNRGGQELLPLARIIAAQFASIVAPAPAEAQTGVASA